MKFWTLTLPFLILGSLPAADREPPDTDAVRASLTSRNMESGNTIHLPLEATEVALEITGAIQSTTVTQTFVNPTTSILEAVYIFPLPSDATVTGMELQVGDRIIRSVVQEREQAKQTYEAAKAKGQKTAILEQERPNIFTTSVANIAPGQRVQVRFTTLEALATREGEVSVTFPMVVGQRYLPPQWEQQEDGTFALAPPKEEDHRLNPPLLPLSFPAIPNLSLRATVSGLPIRDISSTTHAITVEEAPEGTDQYRVTLTREQVIPDAEFNLKLRLRQAEEPQLRFLESSGETGHHGLLTLFPPAPGEAEVRPAPRDVTFLIDTSGSMSGESIGQAKAGLLKCLDMLRPEDRFNIIRFATNFSSFAPEPRQATVEKLGQAREYIRNLEADGGTNMHPALAEALAGTPRKGSLKLVIFLTDGAVGNETDLIRLLHQKLGRTRLFTFAIGSAPNEYLIQTMAEQGRGQARFIRSHEDIGTEMSDFFRTLESPVLTDITLHWQDAQGRERQDVQLYPSVCPDVFAHRPLQVVIASEQPLEGQGTVRGTRDGKPVSFTFDILPSGRSYPAIEKLAGKAKIDVLMLEHLQADTPELREDIREAVVETALRYQLVSRFTSRVAVEEQVTVDPDGTRRTEQVRVPLPRGWNPAGFTATATTDPLWMLLSTLLLLTALLPSLLWGRLNKACQLSGRNHRT